MKLSYNLKAVCGVVYTQGNLLFHPSKKAQNTELDASSAQECDPRLLYAAIGHRINRYNLKDGSMETLPITMRHSIDVMSISPNGQYMILMEKKSCYGMLIQLEKSVILKRFRVKESYHITCIQFSPDSRFVIMGGSRFILVWGLPCLKERPLEPIPEKSCTVNSETALENGKKIHTETPNIEDMQVDAGKIEFLPLRKLFEIRAHFDDIRSIQFSPHHKSDLNGIPIPSWYVLTSSKDMTARIFLIEEKMAPSSSLQDAIMTMLGDDDKDEPESPTNDVLPENEKWNYEPVTLRAHKDPLVGAYYISDNVVVTVSYEGALFYWQRQDDSLEKLHTAGKGTKYHNKKNQNITVDNWLLIGRDYLDLSKSTGRISSLAYNRTANLLLVGLTSGVFQLCQFLDTLFSDINDISEDSASKKFRVIQTLNIFPDGGSIDSVTFSEDGQWLALACQRHRTLAVYEWNSETFILKQHGVEYHGYTCAGVSSDFNMSTSLGMICAAGDYKGTLTLYDPERYLSYVSFPKQHDGPITSLYFSKGSQVLLSSGTDGTVRAHDLLRYRSSFRVMTTPDPISLSLVICDPSGEFIMACSNDAPFSIYCWYLITGILVQVWSGHEGPITALAMDPLGRYLLSGSSDRSVRQWTLFNSASESSQMARGVQSSSEPLYLTSEITYLAYSPNGREFLVCSLNGQLVVYVTETLAPITTLSATLDLPRTRASSDSFLASKKFSQMHYTAVAYAKDQSLILAAGNTPFLVLYDGLSKSLLKVITLSDSLLLDGTLMQLSATHLSQTLTTEQLKARQRKLPGTTSSLDKRTLFPEFRISHVDFMPDNRSFVILSTEGLLFFALDSIFSPSSSIFDPIQLTSDITPNYLVSSLAKSNLPLAFQYALRLNDEQTLRHLFLSCPPISIPFVVDALANNSAQYLPNLLALLSGFLSSPSTSYTKSSFPIEFVLTWCRQIFCTFGFSLKKQVFHSSSHLSRIAATQFSQDTSNVPSSELPITPLPFMSSVSTSSGGIFSQSAIKAGLLPHLIAIQTNLRKIYAPLAKLNVENLSILSKY